MIKRLLKYIVLSGCMMLWAPTSEVTQVAQHIPSKVVQKEVLLQEDMASFWKDNNWRSYFKLCKNYTLDQRFQLLRYKMDEIIEMISQANQIEGTCENQQSIRHTIIDFINKCLSLKLHSNYEELDKFKSEFKEKLKNSLHLTNEQIQTYIICSGEDCDLDYLIYALHCLINEQISLNDEVLSDDIRKMLSVYLNKGFIITAPSVISLTDSTIKGSATIKVNAYVAIDYRLLLSAHGVHRHFYNMLNLYKNIKLNIAGVDYNIINTFIKFGKEYITQENLEELFNKTLTPEESLRNLTVLKYLFCCGKISSVLLKLIRDLDPNYRYRSDEAVQAFILQHPEITERFIQDSYIKCILKYFNLTIEDRNALIRMIFSKLFVSFMRGTAHKYFYR